MKEKYFNYYSYSNLLKNKHRLFFRKLLQHDMPVETPEGLRSQVLLMASSVRLSHGIHILKVSTVQGDRAFEEISLIF